MISNINPLQRLQSCASCPTGSQNPEPAETFTRSASADVIPDPRKMVDLYRLTWSNLESKLRERGLAEHLPYLARAYAVAEKAHAGQKRDEGLPYIHHPVRVAYSLLEEQGVRDPSLLAAGLLHDVLEDSDVTREELRGQFGDRAADLVSAVTKERPGPGQSKDQRNLLYLRHLATAPRDVIALKLADRLDNVRYLHMCGDEGKRDRYKEETRTWLLPLAERYDPRIHREMSRLCEA